MIWTNPTTQRTADMPHAARVRPAMLINGWLDGVSSTFAGVITTTQGRNGETAKRSTRLLGRLST